MKPVVGGNFWRGMRFALPAGAACWALIIVAAFALAGCNSLTPSTRIDIAFDDGGGKKITAHYESAKEFASPSFRLTRDPETGRITGIDVAAENSTSAGVIMASTEFVTALGQGIAAGLGSLVGAAAKGAVRGGVAYQPPVILRDLDQVYGYADASLRGRGL